MNIGIFSKDVLHPSVGYLIEGRSLLFQSPREESASLDEALLRCSFRFVYSSFESGSMIFLSFPDLMYSSTLRKESVKLLLNRNRTYKRLKKISQAILNSIDVLPLYELSFCFKALSRITSTSQPKF